MELIKRETFNRWAQKNNWMQINEALTSHGRQYTYITPAGAMVVVIIDLKGNLMGIGQPMPTSQLPPFSPKTLR